MYTKEYFRQQLSDIISPIEKYYNGGKVQYARHSAWYENLSADVEAFARPLWGLVPFWAGGGENETFEKLYITGITSGADKKNDGYWGDCHDKDQRFVEMAAFAYGLIFAPEKVWEPLKSTAKNNFEKWLYSINDKEVCDSNWTFFRVLVNVALKKVGRKYSQEQLDKDIARIDEFYLGNGWYIDGLHGQKDYYIGFAFHFYGLIYAVAMEDDDKERSDIYKERATEFAKTFIYWFDEDGEALPYGRSLTYRFAQAAFWGACILAGIRPFSLVSRRNGKSVAYPAGTITDFACGQIVPKYLKFAYSAHFGFNVMRSNISIDEAACDSMLTFVVDGAVLVRRHLKSYNVENDRVVIEWSPFKGFDVKTVITPTTFGHTRSHEINSEYDCVAYDAGFAVASRDKDNIKTKDSFIAQARNDFQFCEVLTETGGEGCIIESSPNTNIRYSKTVIPAMKYEIHKGKNEIKTLIRDHLEG